MTDVQPTILLVDGDAATCRAWRQRLEACGAAVVATGDGEAALREALAALPDLIVFGSLLPGLDASALYRVLRGHPATRDIPILAIGAAAEDGETPADADDVLPPGLSQSELAVRIRLGLRLKHLQDKLRAERDGLEGILSHLQVPVVVCEQTGRILIASAAFLKLAQLPRALVRLQTLDEVLAALAVPEAARRQLQAADGKPVTIAIAPTGETLKLVGRAAPVAFGRERATAFVFRDITEQAAQERMTADFQSMVAHDLRSPLAVIQGYAALIASKKAGPVTATQAEFLDHILQKVEQLTELLNDFLEISRIEAGFIDLDRDDVVIEELLADCLEDLGPAIRDKNLRVESVLEPDGLHLGCDPLRLKQILQNLLSNAIKYNEPGGWIRVRASRNRRDVVLEIADGGMGLTPEEQVDLFRPYRRGRAERKIKGVGLGLAIVKRLVEAHAGTISVSSRSGEGATFTVILPVGLPLPKRRRVLIGPAS